MRENGTLHWLLGDHLGSTAITADADGNKGAELRYKAWGETRYAWGDTPTSRRFTGQVEDDTIGLYFYNSRFYDPALGRFIKPDTIVPNPSDPQDLNRYSYVRNSPLVYVDPSGHWYYDPGCDCLVQTDADYNEWPDNLFYKNGANSPLEMPSKAACEALSGTSSPCGDLGPVEKTIIAGFVLGPILLPLLIETAPGWLVALQASGGTAATAEAVLAACGGDCSDELQSTQGWMGEILYKFNEADGSFRYVLRKGEEAISLARALDFETPAHAFYEFFGRWPGPSDSYRIVDAGTLWLNRFYPVYDALQRGMPQGHVSVYAGETNLWTKMFEVMLDLFGGPMPFQ